MTTDATALELEDIQTVRCTRGRHISPALMGASCGLVDLPAFVVNRGGLA